MNVFFYFFFFVVFLLLFFCCCCSRCSRCRCCSFSSSSSSFLQFFVAASMGSTLEPNNQPPEGSTRNDQIEVRKCIIKGIVSACINLLQKQLTCSNSEYHDHNELWGVMNLE